MRYLIVLLCLATVWPACAQGSKDEAAIRQLYARYEKAYVSKDIGPVMDVTTADYTASMKDGTKLTRAQYRTAMVQQLKQVQKESIKIASLQIQGTHATVVTEETIDAQALGTHVMGSVSKGRDTWVKTAAGWKLSHTESLSEVYTMDGQPFDPSQYKP